MAKRKSFDEKNKGMHKSRKLIIDTVFGRTDNNQKVHGYESETEVKRKFGEKWTDKNGDSWEQLEAGKIKTSELGDTMAEVRAYLDKLNTCSNENCKTSQYTHIDKKLVRKTGLCLDCLQKQEISLRADGTWPFFEDYKITKNKLGYIRDAKDKYEEALCGVKQEMEIVTQEGKVEKWTWDIDIEKVKTDIQKDIDGAYEAIELLVHRKALLEDKLRELNHPELIK